MAIDSDPISPSADPQFPTVPQPWAAVAAKYAAFEKARASYAATEVRANGSSLWPQALAGLADRARELSSAMDTLDAVARLRAVERGEGVPDTDAFAALRHWLIETNQKLGGQIRRVNTESGSQIKPLYSGDLSPGGSHERHSTYERPVKLGEPVLEAARLWRDALTRYTRKARAYQHYVRENGPESAVRPLVEMAGSALQTVEALNGFLHRAAELGARCEPIRHEVARWRVEEASSANLTAGAALVTNEADARIAQLRNLRDTLSPDSITHAVAAQGRLSLLFTQDELTAHTLTFNNSLSELVRELGNYAGAVESYRYPTHRKEAPSQQEQARQHLQDCSVKLADAAPRFMDSLQVFATARDHLLTQLEVLSQALQQAQHAGVAPLGQDTQIQQPQPTSVPQRRPGSRVNGALSTFVDAVSRHSRQLSHTTSSLFSNKTSAFVNSMRRSNGSRFRS